MKSLLYILFLYLSIIETTPLIAQKRVAWRIELDSIDVVTKYQKLSASGQTRTHLSPFALRESVTNSLAEVLSRNSSIFIKSYGRGSIATASFRGTAPSHTQVTWNGLKINSPMLGMVDFSLIPSYFIDDATIYHGASSISVSSGGLGGAIELSNTLQNQQPIGITYIQGIGSFSTYDEFLKLEINRPRFASRTRFVHSQSENDFRYKNYDKYSPNGEYPIEKNKNGEFKDIHLMQEFFWKERKAGEFTLSTWVTQSERGVPMLNVDYREGYEIENKQDENTLRIIGNWKYQSSRSEIEAKLGYQYNEMLYRFSGNRGTDQLIEMISSTSKINSAFTSLKIKTNITDKWVMLGSLSVYQNSVESFDKYTKTGYQKVRGEYSVYLSTRYWLTSWLKLGVDVRQELIEDHLSPFIPAAFIDIALLSNNLLSVKASCIRNHHQPSLNDLYFQPGGNPELLPENGYTYDIGLTSQYHNSLIDWDASVTGYNSHIENWIIWLPTFKGYWTPKNVKKVHSYGIESRANVNIKLKDWLITFHGNWAWTPSINHGDPTSWADESIGKQLVYIPKYSSSFSGRIGWNTLQLTYQYNYYSNRNTTSSNDMSYRIGHIGPYYMNSIHLGKEWRSQLGQVITSLKIDNLFDEEYVSVLSRPMPGRNYTLQIEITPKF